jgi:hypothetical protein
MTQCNAFGFKITGCIRATVSHSIRQPADQIPFNRIAFKIQYATDTTHGY